MPWLEPSSHVCVVTMQDPSLEEMSLPGVDVTQHDRAHTLLDDFFYVSGHIPRITPYEEGNPMHATQWVSVCL